mgnify:CR=1 FL=1
MMKRLLICLFVTTLNQGCDLSQYDPSKHWQTYKKEREFANKKHPKLSKNGRLQVPPAKKKAPTFEEAKTKDPLAKIRQTYLSYCATCHGNTGAADTAAAKALNPNPRNFSSSKWQDSVSDEHILKVIKEGGSASGLSAVMAAFGGMLSEQQ